MRWLSDIIRRKKVTPEEEADYRQRLHVERHMYAWTLVHTAGVEEAGAATRAEERYKLLPASDRYREMIFHDEAWHIAMLDLHGNCYWHREPGLEKSPEAYQQELKRVWAESRRSGIA
jgi:hypothetical protein